MNSGDATEIFEPRILYPSSDLTQPDRTSTKKKIEEVQVKYVPLPFEQMITDTRPSHIETIELNDLNGNPERLADVNKNSNIPTDTVHSEHRNTRKNPTKVAHSSEISKTQMQKSSKAKIKHKKLLGIHIKVRQTPKVSQ